MIALFYAVLYTALAWSLAMGAWHRIQARKLRRQLAAIQNPRLGDRIRSELLLLAAMNVRPECESRGRDVADHLRSAFDIPDELLAAVLHEALRQSAIGLEIEDAELMLSSMVNAAVELSALERELA